ncbi:PAS domain S-box protein, partial [Clostridium sp. Cult1]|nr:PAS domain S-box protein [Clostridium sp. Cult1]
DLYVLIRYFAVRSKDGEYLGTLEFTQNIAPIKEIEGEKRLLSE